MRKPKMHPPACQKKGRFFKIIFQGIIGYTARPAPGEAIQHDSLTGPLSRGGSSLLTSVDRVQLKGRGPPVAEAAVLTACA